MQDDAVAGQMMEADVLANRLGLACEGYPLESAVTAIKAYRAGQSTRMAQRESGVPERTIERWIAFLGIKRGRAESVALKRDALAKGRIMSVEVRKGLGAY